MEYVRVKALSSEYNKNIVLQEESNPPANNRHYFMFNYQLRQPIE